MTKVCKDWAVRLNGRLCLVLAGTNCGTKSQETQYWRGVPAKDYFRYDWYGLIVPYRPLSLERGGYEGSTNLKGTFHG